MKQYHLFFMPNLRIHVAAMFGVIFFLYIGYHLATQSIKDDCIIQ